MAAPALDIAYLHFGTQSGVTQNVTRALEERGHQVHPLRVPGPLELRDERGRRRLSWRAAVALSVSAAKFGRRALDHRWNTTHAFDAHSRRAARLLNDLWPRPGVVLQNGALFAPGSPPVFGYALLLDHTRALSMEQPVLPEEGLPAPVDYGSGWRERETTLYRRARCIATFSRRVALSLERDYGVSRERIHVVGAGAGVFPRTVVRRDDSATIVFVGKDFRRKGGPLLLRAFEQLRRRRPDARLLIAGPSDRWAVPAGVTQLGPVPIEQLPDLFARASLFVLPTLREPFGIAFLDAMACGLPCIGTDIEAVPEVIEQGVTGLLVPPGDEGALAEAMCALLDDPQRSRRMGLAGRARLEREFTWAHSVRRLEQALRIASGRDGSSRPEVR